MDMGVRFRDGGSEKMEENEHEAGVHCTSCIVSLNLYQEV